MPLYINGPLNFKFLSCHCAPAITDQKNNTLELQYTLNCYNDIQQL